MKSTDKYIMDTCLDVSANLRYQVRKAFPLAEYKTMFFRDPDGNSWTLYAYKQHNGEFNRLLGMSSAKLGTYAFCHDVSRGLDVRMAFGVGLTLEDLSERGILC